MKYLTPQDVLFIHSALIDETGGEHGLRDLGLLESALAQPRQSFGGKDLHANLEEKAAALVIALMKNHPFLDGNKRAAVTSLSVFLELNGGSLIVEKEPLADFAMKLADGRLDKSQALRWIQQHTTLHKR